MLWNSWHTCLIVPLQEIFEHLFSVSVVAALHLLIDQQLICEQIPKFESFWHHWHRFNKESNSVGLIRSLLKWSATAIERKMNGDNKALAGEPWQLLLSALMQSIARFCVHQDRYRPQMRIQKHNLATRKSPKSLLRTLWQFVVYCNIVQH